MALSKERGGSGLGSAGEGEGGQSRSGNVMGWNDSPTTRGGAREHQPSLRPINTRRIPPHVSGGSSLLTATRSAPSSPLARSFSSSSRSGPSSFQHHHHLPNATSPTSPLSEVRPSHIFNFQDHELSSMTAAMPTLPDIENLKLARACGMIPDQHHLQRRATLHSPISFVPGFPPAIPGTPVLEREHAPMSIINSEDALQKACAYVKQLVDKKKPAHIKYDGDDHQVTIRSSSSPRFSPSQSALSHFGKTRRRERSPSPSSKGTREPPPFVPVQDAQLIVTQLDRLLEDLGLIGDDTASKGLRVHEVRLDKDRLLHEHRIDSQLADMRAQWERDIDDDRLDLFEQERGTAVREWRKDVVLVDVSDSDYRVFGQPLCLTRLYASSVACMGGYQHDLPTVVYACVEELYRTGMTTPSLFRAPPDRIRHKELIDEFNHGPSFGRYHSLAKESTADICALLRTYLDRLPEPLWHESLFDAFWTLCVEPSVLREKRALEELNEGHENTVVGLGRSGGSSNSTTSTRPISLIQIQHRTYGPNGFEASSFSPSLRRQRSASLDALLHEPSSFFRTLGGKLDIAAAMHASDADLVSEHLSRQIDAARLLFRLLPHAQMSVLAYLMGFFSQVPLCAQANGLGMEDVARLFGVGIFLGKEERDRAAVMMTATMTVVEEGQLKRKEQARTMMAWLLRRWSLVSEGLFEPLAPLPAGTEPTSAEVGYEEEEEGVEGEADHDSATLSESTLSDSSSSLFSLSSAAHSAWPESFHITTLNANADIRAHRRRSSLLTDDGIVGYDDCDFNFNNYEKERNVLGGGFAHFRGRRKNGLQLEEEDGRDLEAGNGQEQEEEELMDDLVRLEHHVQAERSIGEIRREIDELKARLGGSLLVS